MLACSVAVQVLRILQAYYLGRGLGIEAPLATYFAFLPLILLVMLLPVTVNGLGTGQAAFVWFFAQVGVPAAPAFALSVLFVALGIVGNLPGGILYALGPRRAGVAQVFRPARMTAPLTTCMRSLSIIIPAYNESENIIDTLDNVTTALEPLTVRHEILVIDDGSTDTTAALVTSNLNRFPAVRLLVNERNMGFGWSYRRGVDAAALDHIVMVHGDNAWGYETLREFFSRVGEADVIVGYTRDMWSSRTRTRTLISKALHAGREPDHLAPSEVLQRPADSPRAGPQEPADSVERLRISVRSARQEPAPHQDRHRSADGSDRAREGREQGVSPQERRRRAAHAQGAVRRGARPGCVNDA